MKYYRWYFFQLEEQKILESTRGQTRNIAKTRLELTWEKERAELQHLLSDTQKMVADLKNRNEQVELEREKEKQAMRKQLLDMRNSMEKERQESRRKMSEVRWQIFLIIIQLKFHYTLFSILKEVIFGTYFKYLLPASFLSLCS